MKLECLAQELGLSQRVAPEDASAVVEGGYTGDLLSDVIGCCEPGQVWVTRQVHPNIVAVAALKDLPAIIIVQGAEPEQQTLDKAAEEGVAVYTTQMSAFETSGRIFNLLVN